METSGVHSWKGIVHSCVTSTVFCSTESQDCTPQTWKLNRRQFSVQKDPNVILWSIRESVVTFHWCSVYFIFCVQVYCVCSVFRKVKCIRFLNVTTFVIEYANSWNEPHRDKTNKMACAPSEDSDQPGHPPSLIRVFAVRLKKASSLSYSLSAQRRLWSDWADAQADLSLRRAHMPFR